MEKNDLIEDIKEMSKADLYKILKHLIKSNDIFKQEIEKYIENKLNNNTQSKCNAINYWNKAKKIISKFNEYGGGSYNEEEKCIKYLDNIILLNEEGKIPRESKVKIIKEGFFEYHKQNSGFEDSITDMIFSLCGDTKELWYLAVDKLKEDPTDYNQSLIISIYRDNLEDNEKYLQERNKKLNSGMDFWNLAEFYIYEDNIEKAVITCEDGLKKGKGRKNELFEYLISYYINKDDEDNIIRILEVAEKEKYNMSMVLNHIYEYYMNKNEYEKCKTILLKLIDSDNHEDYYDYYNKLKTLFSKEQFENMSVELLDNIEKKDLSDYLLICINEKKYENILRHIVNPKKNYMGKIDTTILDQYASLLKNNYPREIINYYKEVFEDMIKNGNRNIYKKASVYIRKMIDIYINILKDEKTCKLELESIRRNHKQKRALIEELSIFN